MFESNFKIKKKTIDVAIDLIKVYFSLFLLFFLKEK